MINFLNEMQTPTYIFSMQVEQDFSSLKQFFASLPLAKRSNKFYFWSNRGTDKS